VIVSINKCEEGEEGLSTGELLASNLICKFDCVCKKKIKKKDE
jgi:hypothetical protein